MNRRANIASIEGIEAFRTTLILFRREADTALTEVQADIRRTRLWLQDDRLAHWETQIRQRTHELQQAQQDCFSARLSDFNSAVEAKKALRKAKQALAEAESKLRLVKRWRREYARQVEPLSKHLETLANFLAVDTPKATAHLAHVLENLHAYVRTAPPEPAASDNRTPQPAGRADP